MPVKIPIEKLKKFCNPLKTPPWSCVCNKDSIKEALQTGRINKEPYTPRIANYDHAGRIAYFIRNPPTDPIGVDVGVPALGCYVKWPIIDGNHRLAAAIYKRKLTIAAVVDGSLNYAFELFGIDCKEKQ